METSLLLPKSDFPEILSILNYAVIIYLHQLSSRLTYIEKKTQRQCLNKIQWVIFLLLLVTVWEDR